MRPKSRFDCCPKWALIEPDGSLEIWTEQIISQGGVFWRFLDPNVSGKRRVMKGREFWHLRCTYFKKDLLHCSGCWLREFLASGTFTSKFFLLESWHKEQKKKTPVGEISHDQNLLKAHWSKHVKLPFFIDIWSDLLWFRQKNFTPLFFQFSENRLQSTVALL